MAYLKEFQKQIYNRDFPKLLELWEEYIHNEPAEVNDFIQILAAIRSSELTQPFGKHVETALPLWQTIENQEENYQVLRLIMDLQNTNTPVLAEAAFQVLKAKYQEDPQFNEKIRLVGLRTRENFQGALRSFDLLNHMEKGKFVFHIGGWGTGEIMDFSPVREELTIEFENVQGFRQFTFENAFKSLEPLSDTHFLARRFSDPDTFEEEAKKDPIGVIKQLLKQLGPKTAAEIKDEVCVLIIPEDDWTKWWQAARSKLKKDPFIDAPTTVHEPFILRESEVTQDELAQEQFLDKTDISELIIGAYNYLRDLPRLKKNQEVREKVRGKLVELLSRESNEPTVQLQLGIIYDLHFDNIAEICKLEDILEKIENVESTLDRIEIIALKKRALTLVREHSPDWEELFLKLFATIQPAQLRDYVFTELQHTPEKLLNTLQELAKNPLSSPETIVWYFQKIFNTEDSSTLPFSDKEGQCEWFDAFLVLLSEIEQRSEYRDLFKKMYNILTQKRYETVRTMFNGASVEWIQEYLLLLSKCMAFTANDKKIFKSLAEVAQPSLSSGKKSDRELAEEHTLWATEEAYQRIQERANEIGTVEIVKNAKEVEAARELGDLRENAEYKYACEKRRQLQGELKRLTDELREARILRKDDVDSSKAGVGTIVSLSGPNGSTTEYTILGPWDADPDQNILSTHSKLAEAMIGQEEGACFTFRDEEYTIKKLSNYFDN